MLTQELVNKQELPSLLQATVQKLKQVSEKYSSKSALGELVSVLHPSPPPPTPPGDPQSGLA